MKPAVPFPEAECLFCDINSCAENCLSLHQFSESLGNAVDAKDSLTHNHSQHVAVVSYLIALGMGFTIKQAEVIHIAGHLHDIGKIGIPDAILNKKQMFTEIDWLFMRRHPQIGAQIIKPVKAFHSSGGISEIILHHHAKYDGTGYPSQIHGKEIPIGARIVSIADALSALIQDRPYRKGRSYEAAVDEIQKHSGTQFDPDIVKTFVEINTKIRSMLEAL